ncbi:ABC transporter permease [Planctomycetota bacterium]
MHKIYKVAKREYLDSVRTKTFIFSLLMTPLFIGVMIFINSKMPKIAGNPEQPPLRKVQLTDLTGQLAPRIRARIDNHNQADPDHQIQLEETADEEDPETVRENANNQILNGQLDVHVVIEEDIIDGEGRIQVYTQTSRIVNMRFVDTIVGHVRNAIIQQRCETNDVTWEFFAQLDRYIPFETYNPASTDGEKVSEAEMISAFMVPFLFLFMMFFGIFVMGQQILTSVVEEKSSRIIEMLLSALTPFELMAGKIIGLTAVGLTIIIIWAAAVYGVMTWQGVNLPVGWEIFPFFVIYYVLGFMLLTSILAAIGSTCNTTKEAQSLMTPVTIMFVAPMMTWFILAQNPNGTLAVVFSFIPPITPMIMMLRIAASDELPLLHILATIVLMLVSVPVVMWMAGKVFRTGILMYGKRPGLREILRWCKAS